MGREVKRVKEYLAGECYESIRRPKSPCRFRMIPQVSTNLYIFGMVRVHGPWCHRYSKSKTLSATCWAHGAGMAQDISSYAQMQQAAKLVQHNPKIAQKWDDHEDLLVKRCSWSLVHWPNQQQQKSLICKLDPKYDENNLGLFGRLIPAPGLPIQLHYLL